MPSSLIKSCLAFTEPLGLAWLLLTLWLISVIWRRLWRWSLLPALAWLVLSLIACTPLSSWLLAQLEGQTPRMRIEDVPAADVILCLGGGAEPSLTEPTGVHLKNSADRISTALMLAAQNKGSALVISGGIYPNGDDRLSEADAVVSFLRRQLPAALPIISLGSRADTHDEALTMAELAQQRGWKSILLVTSASHMPRSVAVFAKAGLEVTPVPCNYLSSFNRVGEIDWLHVPHEGGFASFSVWSHEIIGAWIYRYRHWID